MLNSIESTYSHHCAGVTAIALHLPTLMTFASVCDLAVEFGVKRGASSAALLMGAKRLISFDVVETREARQLEAVAGGRWDYRIEDSRKADVPECDLLFIDSLHTYGQMREELAEHGNKARRYLIFHDVTTFGEVGAVGESGAQAWTYVKGQSCPPEHQGIRPAIDLFQIEHPYWRVYYRSVASHGLLVLQRDP